MIVAGPNPEKIRTLFSSIAHGYDRANDVMTFGLARRWRKSLVKWSGAKSGTQVLDCATGTGDLALDFKKTVGPKGQVTGIDFCKEMLDIAPRRAQTAGLEIRFELADVLNLPFSDGQFDIASIAYGIRNVSDPIQALAEMARVCRPGGKVMILETGEGQIPGVRSAMNFYFQKIVPRLGGWVTGKPQAYEYLSESSLKFPSRQEFVKLMKATGSFAEVDCRSLMGGASYLYRGLVL